MKLSLAMYEIIFWISTGVVVYTYLLYPLFIWILARSFPKPVVPPRLPASLPRVSLLIAAHNEQADIAKRIDNALSLEYPRDLLEIVIASDGSTDATCSIVRKYAPLGVLLYDYPQREGKPAVLNKTIPHLRGEIVFFSDANTFTQPDALKKLVRWFSDPVVGVVCGKLVLIDAHTGKNVDSAYWKYENFLKKQEGRLGALLGSNGAIYAIRREWYPDIPDNTIVDDFVIPLRTKVTHNCKIVYETEALAYEVSPSDIGTEYRRRIRIGAGDFQAIGLLHELLLPRYGWTTFAFWNHKIFRWICPFLLLASFVTNLTLMDQSPYSWLFVGQIIFYSAAVLGNVLPSRPVVFKVFRLTTMFTTMNIALLFGFFRWLTGTQRASWHRTTRLVEAVETVK
ncbi:MAG TPA: glycosyltransferase family 2 protein [Gemmatales bacterium]|nr:glycosyltransferase family 2 protein [Gemmatales bacterium]